MEINNISPDKPTKSSKGINRRNLVKGAAATGVLLSVSSRSAWGANCSISGMLSGNMSRTNEYTCTNRASKSPGFWTEHFGCWSKDINMGQIDAKCQGVSTTLKIATDLSPGIDKRFIKSRNGKNKEQVKLSGTTHQVEDYYFYGGHSVNDFLLGVTQFPNTIYEYLTSSGDSLGKHLASAILTAYHPVLKNNFYTPLELTEAVLAVIGDPDKEAQLDQILQTIQRNGDDISAQDLVVAERFANTV